MDGGIHFRTRAPPNSLNDGVASCRFPKPLRAQLRYALLRLEVHVDQSEAVAVTINPFEVVLCTPQEVSMHRDTVGGCTLELREVRTQEHDPVGVVDLAIFGHDVRRAAPVFSDEDRLRAPDRLHVVCCPVEASRIVDVPCGLHLWMRGVDRNAAVTCGLTRRD